MTDDVCLFGEWFELTADQRAQAWQGLCAWVWWLRCRYRLAIEDRLPPCWAEHPELIEELWALRVWRAEAYDRQTGSGQSAVAWHQALSTFLATTASYWAAGCRAGHRRTRPEQDDARLAARWSGADPVAGIPPQMLTDSHTRACERLDADQAAALLAAGEATYLNPDVAEFICYRECWWVQPPSEAPDPTAPWLRVVDPAVRDQLDELARRLDAADQALRAAEAVGHEDPVIQPRHHLS